MPYKDKEFAKKYNKEMARKRYLKNPDKYKELSRVNWFKRKEKLGIKEDYKSLGRNEKGQFIKTTDKIDYKVKQKNGKRKGEHIFVWEEYNKQDVPKGYIIHHVDRNKRNNDISNLQLMTEKDHVKLHFGEYYKDRDVWNKGRKCPEISKKLMGHTVNDIQIARVRCSWFNKYLNSYIDIWKFIDAGLTKKEIANELNLTIDSVNHRWKGFKKVINVDSGRLK